MKTLIKYILGIALLFTGAVAYAEGNNYSQDYSIDDLEEIEVERYVQIDQKWKVEVEFDDSDDVTMYVYEVEDQDDLWSKIRSAVNDRFDFDLTLSQLREFTEIDDDDEDFDDMDEDDEDYDQDQDANGDGKVDKDDDYTGALQQPEAQAHSSANSGSLTDTERDELIQSIRTQLDQLMLLMIQLLSARLI